MFTPSRFLQMDHLWPVASLCYQRHVTLPGLSCQSIYICATIITVHKGIWNQGSRQELDHGSPFRDIRLCYDTLSEVDLNKTTVQG